MRVRILLQITDDDGTCWRSRGGRHVREGDRATGGPWPVDRRGQGADRRRSTPNGRGPSGGVVGAASLLRNVRRTAPRQRQLSDDIPHTLRRRRVAAARGCIAARAKARTVQPPCRRCGLCSLDHVAPERLYLEARWASLVPYAAAAGLLADILPITSGANATTLREHVLHVAERAEAELGEERPCFIDGCPAEWQELPIPEGRIVVGLDGGYVRNWEDRKTQFRGHRRPVVARRS